MTMRFREMEPRDVPGVFRVRTSTRENRVTLERLAELGITPESMARALEEETRGWVCEDAGEVVAFTMGDGATGEVLVLAVLPEAEGQGVGRRLLGLVQEWLFSKGHPELWLMETPDPALRAYGFYRKAGWVPTGEYRKGEQVLRLRRSGG